MISGSILAALTLDLPKQNRNLGRVSSLLLSDVLLIVGLGVALLLLLGGIIYVWMKFRRNRRKHISGGEKVYRGVKPAEEDADDEGPAEEEEIEEQDQETDRDHDEQGQHHDHAKRRYKYRVRRRSHRSRNPTLSETGGLPPVKSQEPSKPY
jgi:hypothetical protein